MGITLPIVIITLPIHSLKLINITTLSVPEPHVTGARIVKRCAPFGFLRASRRYQALDANASPEIRELGEALGGHNPKLSTKMRDAAGLSLVASAWPQSRVSSRHPKVTPLLNSEVGPGSPAVRG